MKTIFLAAAALVWCTGVYAQHNGGEPDVKPATVKAMLDGKAFVVTLTENTPGIKRLDSDHPKDNTSKNDRKEPESSMQNSNQTKPEQEMNTGRKMLIRFDAGMVRVTGKGDLKTDRCPYNSWGMESTGISF